MVTQAQEVLQQMGLSDGYHIPIANAENVKLEADLQQLILAKANAVANLESLSTRCTGLDKHMKYVHNEQMENQNLIVARNTQLEAEKHMYVLNKMEREHALNDIKKLSANLHKLSENRENKCANLKSLMTRMEKLKLAVKWDEQVIETVEKSVLKKSDDNELIKKFSKEDQRKADELEIKRKRLREDELSRRQLATKMANEIECLQLTLGRNIQMYKQMHDERNSMVRQWQESVKQLQQRNKDTIAVVGETATVNDVIAVNYQTLEEQRQFAENERINNYELEATISSENSEITRIRARLVKYSALIDDRIVDVSGIRTELRRNATALEGIRLDRRRTDNILEEERDALKTATAATEQLQQQLTTVYASGMSAEDRTRRLENMVHCEEANTKTLIYDIERMQGLLFRSQKALVELTDIFKTKELTQRVQESATITLQHHADKLEEESRLSAETIYKLNFRVNMLENRLARATGDRRDDNSEVYQLRLRELEAILSSVNDSGNLLQTQNARLLDDMKRMAASAASDDEVLRTMRDRLQNRLLMVEGALKLVAQKRGCNNIRRVEQNVLAVRVKGAERSLKLEGGAVYGLQRQKMELEAAVRERQAEISVEKDLLIIKKRALQEDAGRMRADHQARCIRIEQLKKRLDCILASLGRAEDGETLSVTYFRVRNAQEKYVLQQEGDRLDSLIRKAEREIIAMENTLRVVNGTNDAYKKTLSMLEDDADELKQLQSLEEQQKLLYAELRSINSELVNRGRVVRNIRENLEMTRAINRQVGEEKTEKQHTYISINCDENERKSKLERAKVAALITQCTCENSYKDIVTRELRDVNKSALQQLSEIIIRYIETGPVINRYLSEHSIKYPQTSVTARSSGSKRSLITSTRSNSSNSIRTDASNSVGVPAVLLTLNLP